MPGSTDCTLCPRGTFADTTGLSECVVCAEGMYQQDVGALECETCWPGTFERADRIFCDECPQGWYSGHGATVCLPCAHGNYSDIAWRKRCSTCDAGTFANVGAAAVKCLGCPGGFFSRDGSTACTACPMGWAIGWQPYRAGLVTRGGMASELRTRWVPQNDIPDAQLGGEHVSVSSLFDVDTDLGGEALAASGSHYCHICPKGRHANQPGGGADECSACAPGRYQPLAGTVACDACDAGFFATEWASVDCSPCPAGKVGNSADAAGNFAASSACVACPAGWWSVDGQQGGSCVACPLGFATKGKADFGRLCRACEPGTYADREEPGAAECLPCAPGFFATDEGAYRCKHCAPGQAATRDGRPRCVACLGGRYANKPGTAAEGGADACPLCPAGFWAPANATACTLCAVGTVAPLRGSFRCRYCPRGRFAFPDHASCEPCPEAGATCEDGVVALWEHWWISGVAASEHKASLVGRIPRAAEDPNAWVAAINLTDAPTAEAVEDEGDFDYDYGDYSDAVTATETTVVGAVGGIGAASPMYPCVNREACVIVTDRAAGTTTQSCNAAKGYSGVLCGECAPGYVAHRNRCVECPTGGVAITPMFLLGGAVLLLAGAWANHGKALPSSAAAACFRAFISWITLEALLIDQVVLPIPPALDSFADFSSSIFRSLDPTFYPIACSIAQRSSVGRNDWAASATTGDKSGFVVDYNRAFWAFHAMPFFCAMGGVVLLVFFVPAKLLRQPKDPLAEERKKKEADRIAAMPLHERMIFLRKQLKGEKANPHARATPEQLASRGLWTGKRPRAIALVSWIIYWFYPSVLIACFKGMDCTDEPVEYPDHRRLRADLAVRCFKGPHAPVAKASALLVFVYAAVLPASTLAYGWLQHARGNLVWGDAVPVRDEAGNLRPDAPRVGAMLGWLVAGLSPRKGWWECVVALRKLCVCAALVFVEGGANQAVAVLLVSLAAAALQLEYSPYVHPVANRLETLCVMVLFATVGLVLLLHFGASRAGRVASTDRLTFAAPDGVAADGAISDVVGAQGLAAFCLIWLHLDTAGAALLYVVRAHREAVADELEAAKTGENPKEKRLKAMLAGRAVKGVIKADYHPKQHVDDLYTTASDVLGRVPPIKAARISDKKWGTKMLKACKQKAKRELYKKMVKELVGNVKKLDQECSSLTDEIATVADMCNALPPRLVDARRLGEEGNYALGERWWPSMPPVPGLELAGILALHVHRRLFPPEAAAEKAEKMAHHFLGALKDEAGSAKKAGSIFAKKAAKTRSRKIAERFANARKGVHAEEAPTTGGGPGGSAGAGGAGAKPIAGADGGAGSGLGALGGGGFLGAAMNKAKGPASGAATGEAPSEHAGPSLMGGKPPPEKETKKKNRRRFSISTIKSSVGSSLGIGADRKSKADLEVDAAAASRKAHRAEAAQAAAAIAQLEEDPTEARRKKKDALQKKLMLQHSKKRKQQRRRSSVGLSEVAAREAAAMAMAKSDAAATGLAASPRGPRRMNFNAAAEARAKARGESTAMAAARKAAAEAAKRAALRQRMSKLKTAGRMIMLQKRSNLFAAAKEAEEKKKKEERRAARAAKRKELGEWVDPGADYSDDEDDEEEKADKSDDTGSSDSSDADI